MKERPILFNGDMVRAILDGSKTQTRRIMKPQPFIDEHGWFRWEGHEPGSPYGAYSSNHIDRDAINIFVGKCCPQGNKQDRLWVRETFSANEFMECTYRADGTVPCGWTPSIHMPRWASRITLEITNVRVERLQEISEQDAAAEGFDNSKSRAAIETGWHEKPKAAFHRTWDQIYQNWNQNPWVWVIEFKSIQEAV